MLKRELYTTADGSKSIYLPEWNEYYHSKKGALQEALHVFLNMGLDVVVTLSRKRTPQNPRVSILEYGLGTGFNAFLTAINAPKDVEIHYTAVEAYPVTLAEIEAMDYGIMLENAAMYKLLHELPWGSSEVLTENFYLTKLLKKFQEMQEVEAYDCIYYDVFGPRVQPDLWSLEMFKSAYRSLKHEGILVTYCAAGFVRRNMQEAGFLVERLPGPPGKREMLRARKV